MVVNEPVALLALQLLEAVVAEDAQARRVHEGEPSLVIDPVDAVEARLENEPHALFLNAEPSLHCLALAYVPERDTDATGPARDLLHAGDGRVERDPATVFSHPVAAHVNSRRAVLAARLREVAFALGLVVVAHGAGEQRLGFQALQLSRPVAEDLLGLAVRIDDGASLIGDDQPVGFGVEDLSEPALGAGQFIALPLDLPGLGVRCSRRPLQHLDRTGEVPGLVVSFRMRHRPHVVPLCD